LSLSLASVPCRGDIDPDVLLTRRDPLDSEDARLDSGLGALGGAPLGDVAGLSAGDPRLTSS